MTRAKIAYEKAAEAYDQMTLTQKSGNLLIEAARMAFASKDFSETRRLLLEAKPRFLESGSPRPIIMALSDFAEKIFPQNPDYGLELYDECLTLVEDNNQYHWQKEVFIDVAILYIGKDYQKCLQAWDRAIKAFQSLKSNESANHCFLSKISCQVKEGDIVAAERTISDAIQLDSFNRSDDYSVADFLVRGVKNNDGDLIELAQKNVLLQFLKPQIARIILSFKGPRKAEVVQPQSSYQRIEPEATSEQEEEEEIIDLQ